MTKLWIDDDRELPSFYDHRVSTVAEAIFYLQAAKERGEVLEVISFDYDAHRHLSWTFESVAEWLRDNDYWPEEIRIHTYNYWGGRPWYNDFFARWAPERTTINPIDPWMYTKHRRDTLSLEGAPEWVAKFAEEVKVQS